MFTDQIEKLYSGSDYGQICDHSGVCKFNVSCFDLDRKKINFGFRMYDLTGSTFLYIDSKFLYMPGDEFGYKSNQCYIPVTQNDETHDYIKGN
jgi:hypothetical protein